MTDEDVLTKYVYVVLGCRPDTTHIRATSESTQIVSKYVCGSSRIIADNEKASVSLVLTKSNLFLLRLLQIRVPHFCFSKYLWESLKSELCRRGEVENRDKK